MSLFLEKFSRYRPDDTICGKLSRAEILEIRVGKESKSVEAKLSFPEDIDREILLRIEEDLKTCYALNFVRIVPVFPCALFDDTPEKHIRDVITECYRRGAVSKGFFDKYEVRILEDTIEFTIPFSEGGILLLDEAETGKLIGDILFERYGIRKNIVIAGSGEDEAFLKIIEERENRLQKEYKAAIARENEIKASRAESMNTPSNPSPAFPRVESVYTDPCLYSISDGIAEIGKWRFNISAPEYIFGEPFDVLPVPIRTIRGVGGKVTVVGKLFLYDERPTKNGDKIGFSFAISDGDNSVYVRTYLPADESETLRAGISKGGYFAVTGQTQKDKIDNELSIRLKGLAKIRRIPRADTAEEKRIELHLHTNLSTMDSIIHPEEIVETAWQMGHRAIAVTDHGNLQAYPIVMDTAEKIAKNNPDKEKIRILYGLEAYYVDDTARAVYGEKDENLKGEFVVFDIETTGLSVQKDRITEIGAVKIQNGVVVDRFQSFCDPEIPIPENISELTGITDDMVKGAPKTKEVVESFLRFAKDSILIAHNATFDTGFIRKAAEDHHLLFANTYIDTLVLSRYVNPELKKHRLDSIAEYYRLEDFNHHRADSDAEMLAKIFAVMSGKLEKEGVYTVSEMKNAMGDKADPLRCKTYHMILLVKNKTGLKNLYKIVSDSELKYFRKHPRVPKSLLDNLREGLIVGSACEAGELFTAILEGRSEAEIEEIASYYDYLEIQPICNNRFLIDTGRVKNEEDLRGFNRKIVALGEKLNKPVVATSDAHFLNEEDEIYRQILLHGQEYPDYGRKTSLYFKTTNEMLEEFSYLGEEKAREVVVVNPGKIADEIEDVRPIPKGNFPPHIDGAEEELTDICKKNADRVYGNPLPEIVSERLNKELKSIIEHGFAVMYVIAKRLVEKSMSLGYSVGSRGSVGSSFVATMSGISEVNPLPPHYVCPECKYSRFVTDGSFGSGFDLPPEKCPRCGTPLRSDGHDIPFETFLGFFGDKSPDIDLNFSGDVQAIAHKYTEDLFGADHVFRAGTLSTLAEKTAFGYVMKYLEGRKIDLPKAEIERLKEGCVGVKKTTGQHPGGIIVVPREYDIYDFTPIQHPPKDNTIITTHFPFEYLHDTILKLDILGHDVPTKLKMFEIYSGVPFAEIPMNDPKVYELFADTKPLGVSPEQIGTKLGTLGLPEMSTRFVQQVLIDAKPKNFADLLQISGLTHGTDVWLGNAKELIDNGTCDISHVVGTRDGIMLDLIRWGIENKKAFDIMEDVRKGNRKKLIYEHEADLLEHGVPEWYIESCKKIKYMFPKAHAAAYVMSAIRLGWYKIYHPVAFYAGFFSVVPEGMDAEIITKPLKTIGALITELEEKGTKTTQKEDRQLAALQLTRECRARGIELLPVNFLKSDAKKFLPENGNIRIPFSALPGLGETAAKRIIDERSKGTVRSVEDLRLCAKLPSSIMDLLRKNGVFEGMPETAQMELFGDSADETPHTEITGTPAPERKPAQKETAAPDDKACQIALF